MKTSKFKTLLLMIIISASSFAYVPPFINVNTFNNSKEIHLSFGFGTCGPEQSLSVSITKNMYAFANSTFSIDTMYINNSFNKHFFIEGGLGVTREVSKYWRLIATGGYAYGQFISRTNFNTDYYYYGQSSKYDNINYIAHRFFVALNYGFKIEFLEIYFGGKITIGDYISTNIEEKQHLSALASFEPNFTLKVGVQKLKIVAQIRQSYDYFNSYTNIDNDPFHNSFISFGLELNLNSTPKDK